MNGIILDIILVLLVIICAYAGMKKGLLMTVFSLALIVVSVIVGFVCQSAVGEVLSDMGVEDKIYDRVYRYVYSNCEDIVEESASGIYESAADSMELPDMLKDKIHDIDFKFEGSGVEMITESASAEIAGTISSVINDLLAILIVSVLTGVVLSILLVAVKVTVKFLTMPSVIDIANKIGGMMVGFAVGLFICFLFLALVQIIGTLTNLEGVMQIIDSSVISKYLYKNNLLLVLAIIL